MTASRTSAKPEPYKRCPRQHPGSRNLRGYATLWWFTPSAISVRRLARSQRCDGCHFFQNAHCGNSCPLLAALQQLIRVAISCANLLPVSLPPKETGAPTTAAAPLARDFAAFPLVTIGVTNTECSLATAMPMMVPQPMDRLHLTDSQARPGHRFAVFTRLRISRHWSRQPVQPPPAHFFGGVQEAGS